MRKSESTKWLGHQQVCSVVILLSLRELTNCLAIGGPFGHCHSRCSRNSQVLGEATREMMKFIHFVDEYGVWPSHRSRSFLFMLDRVVIVMTFQNKVDCSKSTQYQERFIGLLNQEVHISFEVLFSKY